MIAGGHEEGADRYFQNMRKTGSKGSKDGPATGDCQRHGLSANRAARGMGYCVKDIEELQHKTKFIRITNAGLKESHPHGVQITRSAEL